MLTALPRRARAARHAARTALVLAALVGAGACDDDDDPTGDDEPEIQSIRLSVTPAGGTATSYTVTTTSNTPVQLRVGTSTVTAQALDASGQVIALDEPFEVRLVSTVTAPEAAAQTPLSGVLSFTGTGTLTGTVTATTAAATRPAWVRLVHLEEQHSDFDAQVQLTVAP